MYDYDDDDGPQGMPALQWGFLFGIVMTVASIAGSFVLRSVDHTKLQNIETLDGNTIGLIIWVAFATFGLNVLCCAGSGFLTARDTGSIKAGAFAGGLALFTATFISAIISFALSLTSPVDVLLAGASSADRAFYAQYANQMAGAGLLGNICGAICGGFEGALVGALGAIPARLIWGPPAEQ